MMRKIYYCYVSSHSRQQRGVRTIYLFFFIFTILKALYMARKERENTLLD